MDVQTKAKDMFFNKFMLSFLPLRILTSVFGSSRFNYANKGVTPPTTVQRFYSLVLYSINVVATMYFLPDLLELARKKAPTAIFPIAVVVVGQISADISHVVHVRLLNGKKTVKLYSLMQDIEVLHKIGGDGVMNNFMLIYNTITVTLMLIGLMVFIFMAVLADIDRSFTYVLCGIVFSYLSVFVDIVYFCNIIMYLTLRVHFINAILKNLLNYKMCRKGKFIPKKYLRRLAATHNFWQNDVNVSFKRILDAFEVCIGLHKFQMVIYSCSFLVTISLTFWVILKSLESQSEFAVEITLMFYLIFVTSLQAVHTCLAVEYFQRRVRKTKMLCIETLSVYIDGPVRDKARKILTLIQERPPVFSVYGMFDVNARYYIVLINISAYLRVTILQFNYL